MQAIRSLRAIPVLRTTFRGVATESGKGTKPKTNEQQDDGSPSSYGIPPKESMTDEKLPESQNEHPGPMHEDGEEQKKK